MALGIVHGLLVVAGVLPICRTRSLKIEEVCKFDDQSPLDALTGSGVAGIVVHDV